MRTGNGFAPAELLGVAVTGFLLSTAAAQETPVLAAPPSASSPSVYHLTLEQAKELALTNNKQLQLGRLNVREKQIAKAAAWKDYFPKLLGNVTYFHFNDNRESCSPSKGER